MERKYVKLEKLGEGSYGAVYKGRDTQSNTYVAMKKINLNLLDEGFPQTYLREVSLLKSLRHENIVHYIDVVWGGDRHIYIIFEHMMNDLRTYMDNCEPNGLRLTAFQSYFHQITKGLAFCHSRATIHRDLKLENILINHRGVVKIADFGLSRTLSIPVRTYTTNVVTLWYRAPELLLGMKRYALPIDIWSLGCMFSEMVTGNALFPGDSEIDEIQKIFRILGLPKEDDWPDVKDLDYYKDSISKLNAFGLEKKVLLRGPGFDLLGKMLIYNPAKRISAKRILCHEYFNGFDSKKMYPPLESTNLGNSQIKIE